MEYKWSQRISSKEEKGKGINPAVQNLPASVIPWAMQR